MFDGFHGLLTEILMKKGKRKNEESNHISFDISTSLSGDVLVGLDSCQSKATKKMKKGKCQMINLALFGIVFWFLLEKLKPKKLKTTTPGGNVWRLFSDMLKDSHVLIAGTTGSGKSVAINGLIATILHRHPVDVADGAQMILLDPKLVELSDYADMPHTIAYAAGRDTDAWMQALNKGLDIMDRRKVYMQKNRLKVYDKGDLYIIIDEWASIIKAKECGKQAYTAVLRLTSEGRAMKVHVVMATQIPKATIIPTEIRENFNSRLCLRTANSIQSRVIMESNGCECLPYPPEVGYASGYYYHSGKMDFFRKLPYVAQTEIDSLLQWWKNPEHCKKVR